MRFDFLNFSWVFIHRLKFFYFFFLFRFNELVVIFINSIFYNKVGIMRLRFPNFIILINNFPVQFFKRYDSKQIVLAVSQVQTKPRFQSLGTIETERRPLSYIWLIISFFLFFFVVFVFVRCHFSLFDNLFRSSGIRNWVFFFDSCFLSDQVIAARQLDCRLYLLGISSSQ